MRWRRARWYADRDRHSNADGYCYSHCDRYSDRNSDRDAFAVQNGHSHKDCDRDYNHNADGDDHCDRNIHWHPHRIVNGYTDNHRNSYAGAGQLFELHDQLDGGV